MASTKTGSASRGQYASDGSAGERELYISAVPAGSARDNLRDFNRIGYRHTPARVCRRRRRRCA